MIVKLNKTQTLGSSYGNNLYVSLLFVTDTVINIFSVNRRKNKWSLKYLAAYKKNRYDNCR